jgi:hypothetical protein
MEFLHEIEDRIAKPGWLSRRTFLGRVAKVSAAVTAFAAGIQLDNAYAVNVACCVLAYSTTCDSNYYQGQCPCPTPHSGDHYEWFCKYNGCTTVCGECYPCKCSYAYQACSLGCPCFAGAPTADAIAKFLPLKAQGTCH